MFFTEESQLYFKKTCIQYVAIMILQVELFRGNTNWGKALDMRKNAYMASQEDKVLVVHIIWGLKEQDRSDCHMTDYECKGRTVFDDTFDMNLPPCQTALMVRFYDSDTYYFYYTILNELL